MKDLETTDLILKESKKLQNVINNELLVKFAELHNIKKEYSKLHSKQEIIAKRGLFLDTKKHYALWITNNEGVPVEEYVQKGLVTRRSDYPSYTKEKIEDILDMLLKKEKVSFGKISKYINKVRNDIQDMILNRDKTIAPSKTFTKDLEIYKKVPHHVLGMLLWNELEYNYFVPGTKGYLFKISGINLFNAPRTIQENLKRLMETECDKRLENMKKLNWIVLPYEEKQLPNYYNIDTSHMISFTWDDRINELLKPIISELNTNVKIQMLSLKTF